MLTTDLLLHPIQVANTLSLSELERALAMATESKPLAADLAHTEYGDLLSWKERGRFADVAAALTNRIRTLKKALDDIKAGKRSAQGRQTGKGKGKQRAESSTRGSEDEGEGSQGGGPSSTKGHPGSSSPLSSAQSESPPSPGSRQSDDEWRNESSLPRPAKKVPKRPPPSVPFHIDPAPSTHRAASVSSQGSSGLSSFRQPSGYDPSFPPVSGQLSSRPALDLGSSSPSYPPQRVSNKASYHPFPGLSSQQSWHSAPGSVTPLDQPVAPFVQNPYLPRQQSSGPPPPPPPVQDRFRSPTQSYFRASDQQQQSYPLTQQPQARVAYFDEPPPPALYAPYAPTSRHYPPQSPHDPYSSYLPQDPIYSSGPPSSSRRPPPRRPVPSSSSFDPHSTLYSYSAVPSTPPSGIPPPSQPFYKEPFLPGPARARSSWPNEQQGEAQTYLPSRPATSAGFPPPLINFQRQRDVLSNFALTPVSSARQPRRRVTSNFVLAPQGRRSWSPKLGPTLEGPSFASPLGGRSTSNEQSGPVYPLYGGEGDSLSSDAFGPSQPQSQPQSGLLPSPSHLITTFSQAWDVKLPPPRPLPVPHSPQWYQQQPDPTSSSSSYSPLFEQQHQHNFDDPSLPQSQQRLIHRRAPTFTAYEPLPPVQPPPPPPPPLPRPSKTPTAPPHPLFNYEPHPSFRPNLPPVASSTRRVTPPEAFLPPLPMEEQPNAPSNPAVENFDLSLWEVVPPASRFEELPDPPRRPPKGSFDFWARVHEGQEGWGEEVGSGLVGVIEAGEGGVIGQSLEGEGGI